MSVLHQAMLMVIPAANYIYSQVFGETLNASSTSKPAFITNCLNAQSTFLATISGASTENFESYASGAAAPFTINFAGGASAFTGVITGTGCTILTNPISANLGRYSVMSATNTYGGTRYINADLNSNDFTITFSKPIIAFGFFGTDIGDFGGQLSVNVYSGATLLRTINPAHTIGAGGSTDGSCLYFGFRNDALFDKIILTSNLGATDVFGFDGFNAYDV